MNNNNKKSMGWNLYEKPVRVRYQITFSYQPGRASVQIQLYQKTFASLAKLSKDTKLRVRVHYNIKFSTTTEFFSIFVIWGGSNQLILS